MQFNRILKILSFGSVCLIIPIIAVATVLEKLYGAEFVHDQIYVALPVLILWGIISFFSIWYLLRMRLYKKIATFGLHLSLVIILLGAFLTHLTGEQGKIHLRVGDNPVSEFIASDGRTISFSFDVSLTSFYLDYYDGTFSPSDFISVIKIVDNGKEHVDTVSMNNIASYKNYRFYQSGFDADREGSILSVSHDPCGIAITYIGYVWLLLAIILFFFQKNTLFSSLLRSPLLKKGLTIILLVISAVYNVKASPTTIPKKVADSLGDLYVYYNGRIAPVGTLAKDFVTKIYGNKNYKGLTHEQVLAGWLFYYDDWKNEPIIKIKGDETKRILGIESSFARLTDFTDISGFKLDKALQEHGSDYNNVVAANEKFNLISSLVTGSILKIYPVKIPEEVTLSWFSVTDKPAIDIPYDQWLFIKSSLHLVAEKIALKDWEGANYIIDKIKKYQINEGGNLLPTEKAIKTEKFYNRSNFDRPLAMVSLSIGIFLFFIFILRLASSKSINTWLVDSSMILIFVIFLYLSMQIGLRWYISAHLPLSNGFETMQFMAWCCSLLTILFVRKFPLVIPFGFLLCGFTLLVAMMGEATPQITNLMPVLHSPLLSIHVTVIMTAYSLLAFAMLDGVAAMLFSLGNNSREKICYLTTISHLILYPAVFLLAIGIFIGAVWANVSWGRYWGWDPKEVWALITLLIYALPLHTNSIKRFRIPKFFHLYCILAFLSVLITYFGVNFFLGGMHAYA